MPAAFFDALGDARTRWLDGDADAWSHYVERCLQLEVELQSVELQSPKRGCASKCSKCKAAAQEPDRCRRDAEASS